MTDEADASAGGLGTRPDRGLMALLAHPAGLNRLATAAAGGSTLSLAAAFRLCRR
jgi:hypothetical protein